MNGSSAGNFYYLLRLSESGVDHHRTQTAYWMSILTANVTPRSSDSTPDAGVVGRMIDKAKADGRWDRAYQRQATAQVPEDLQRALDAEPAANAAFEALKSQPRYHILHQLMIARTAKTRHIRIDRFIVQLQEQNAQDS